MEARRRTGTNSIILFYCGSLVGRRGFHLVRATCCCRRIDIHKMNQAFLQRRCEFFGIVLSVNWAAHQRKRWTKRCVEPFGTMPRWNSAQRSPWRNQLRCCLSSSCCWRLRTNQHMVGTHTVIGSLRQSHFYDWNLIGGWKLQTESASIPVGNRTLQPRCQKWSRTATDRRSDSNISMDIINMPTGIKTYFPDRNFWWRRATIGQLNWSCNIDNFKLKWRTRISKSW